MTATALIVLVVIFLGGYLLSLEDLETQIWSTAFFDVGIALLLYFVCYLISNICR